jgi:Putative DNA-binding domain
MTVTQTQFRTALLDPDQPIPGGLSDGADNVAGARFNVYRNNVAVSLTEAMHSTFPVIAKLLGTRNMDGLAGMFLRQHPPSSPLMMHYGDAFPDFLAGMEQLSHLGYLPDIARLELAIHRSYHASDSDPIAPEALAGLEPDALMSSVITLAPAVEILCSDWPIYDIWRFNSVADAPEPRPVAQDVVVTRAEFDPEPQLLPSGGAIWIRALADGQTIAQSYEAALGHDAEFDLGATLAILLQGSGVVSLTQKDPTS